MNAQNAFSAILKQYGQSVTVYRKEGSAGIPCRAFLQPLREKGEQETPGVLGNVRQDRWLYLGEAAVPPGMPGEGWIQWQNETFRVISAQQIWLGGELNHWRAILKIREPDA